MTKYTDYEKFAAGWLFQSGLLWNPNIATKFPDLCFFLFFKQSYLKLDKFTFLFLAHLSQRQLCVYNRCAVTKVRNCILVCNTGFIASILTPTLNTPPPLENSGWMVKIWLWLKSINSEGWLSLWQLSH